jgi:hypothetical protein
MQAAPTHLVALKLGQHPTLCPNFRNHTALSFQIIIATATISIWCHCPRHSPYALLSSFSISTGNHLPLGSKSQYDSFSKLGLPCACNLRSANARANRLVCNEVCFYLAFYAVQTRTGHAVLTIPRCLFFASVAHFLGWALYPCFQVDGSWPGTSFAKFAVLIRLSPEGTLLRRTMTSAVLGFLGAFVLLIAQSQSR